MKILHNRNFHILFSLILAFQHYYKVHKKGDLLFLNPENDNFKPIEITQEMNFKVWGVVTHIIHKV